MAALLPLSWRITAAALLGPHCLLQACELGRSPWKPRLASSTAGMAAAGRRSRPEAASTPSLRQRVGYCKLSSTKPAMKFRSPACLTTRQLLGNSWLGQLLQMEQLPLGTMKTTCLTASGRERRGGSVGVPAMDGETIKTDHSVVPSNGNFNLADVDANGLVVAYKPIESQDCRSRRCSRVQLAPVWICG